MTESSEQPAGKGRTLAGPGDQLQAIERIAVVIPARDEAVLLPHCLDSLASARRAVPAGIHVELVVVADDCTDRTVAVARGASSADLPVTVVETNVRSVGAARAFGARRALAGAGPPVQRTWLASTDADCRVPIDWLARQLSLAATGAVAVAGVVDLEPATTPPGLMARFRASYLLGADGHHGHVHGANLGCRADAYLAVGGWSGASTGEDHDLWRRLQAVGSTLSTIDLTVVTSARLETRCPDGFSTRLAEHAAADARQRVRVRVRGDRTGVA